MSNDLRNRLGGLLSILIGAAAFWYGVWSPIQQAQASAEQISWPSRIVVLVSIAFVFGVFLLATGDRYPYRDVERQTLTPVGWALFAVTAIAAIASFFWVQTTLTGLGYTANP